jgi:hypothetical protein
LLLVFVASPITSSTETSSKVVSVVNSACHDRAI